MRAVVTGQVNVNNESDDAGLLSLRIPVSAFFFWFLSSIIEMAIDWENQWCLKLLIRLKILWKVILLTWFVRFSQAGSVC